MRHHNPARWPPDDSLGCTAPHDFVQPGMTVGPHDQQVDRVGVDKCLEHFSDGAATDIHRFKGSLYSMLFEMAYKGCPGFQFRLCLFVGCSDDAHAHSHLKQWQCV